MIDYGYDYILDQIDNMPVKTKNPTEMKLAEANAFLQGYTDAVDRIKELIEHIKRVSLTVEVEYV